MKEILIPLNFTTTPTVYDTKQSFSTSDEASGVLTFTTTADVAGTVASLTIHNANENANRQTVLIERLDVNTSPFSYTLKNPLPFGQYEGTVLLKKNLTVIASASFLFGVNSSLSAEVLPDLVKAYSLDELVENVETEVSNLKDAFNLTVSETVKGVNKTESSLQAQENVRYLNEHQRKANELERIANENARIAAEVERKDTFDTLVDSAVIEETVVQEVAEKYQEIEALNAPEMVSFRQQLADTLNKSAITLTHMFVDNTARDAYFVAHPTELLDLQFIKVGTGYQQYIEGAWQASTAIVAEQLSATNQPITDTGNYFATDTTNAALQEIGAKLFVKCKNKLINGNLSDGLNNWLITGTIVLDSGAAKIDYTVSGRLRQNIVGSTNDKIYTRMVQTVVGATDGANIIEFRKNSVRVIFQSMPTQSGAFSNVSTLSGDVDDFSIVRLAGTSGYVLVDNLMMINLTETFGAGNEPTTAQMDRLLTQFPDSWFNGTENIFLAKWALNELGRLENEKAKKVQEEWITPTLTNGATGTFKYRKNELGRLELKGEVKQASTASPFCTTIVGYRPLAIVRCPIAASDGVVSTLIVSTTGAVSLHTPLAGKTISFSGISINIQ